MKMKAPNAAKMSKPPSKAPMVGKMKMHPDHAHVAKVASALHGSDPGWGQHKR